METPIPPPQLDGELRLDDETRRERAEDFGHLVHHLPQAVLMPGVRGRPGQDDPVVRAARPHVRRAGPAPLDLRPRAGPGWHRRRTCPRCGTVAARGGRPGRRRGRGDVERRTRKRRWPHGRTPPGAHRVPRSLRRRHPCRRRRRRHDLDVRRTERQRDRTGGRDRRGKDGQLLGEPATPTCSTRCAPASVRWVSSPKRLSRSSGRRRRCADSC